MLDDAIKILVVDDTPQNLVTLEAILEEPGLTVVKARSGRDALRQLLQEEFAAILLDVNMPDMDGFEAATLIRQRPTSSRTPILFLTAYPGEEQLERAYALGAVDYMLTPVQPDVLRAKVSVFADLYRKSLEIRRQAELLRVAEQRLRQQAEVALRESEGRFRVLCTCAPLAIFQTDAQGRCVYVSPLWETATGQSEEASRGFGWIRALDPENSGAVLTSWQAASAERHVWSYEQRLSVGRADERWVHVMASPILGEDSRLMGHVGTVEDITPRKLTEQRLRDSDRRKDEFIAMLAHELRNPLAAITSALVISRTPGMESRREWSTQVIARQAQHLSKLIDDLLDVSRVTLGKIQLHLERVDAAAVLARAFEAIHATFEGKHQQLDVELDGAPLWVDADPTRLEQVFVNLLGNASKYSDEGSRVQLTARTDGAWVVVRVRDQGIGIEPALLPRIFDLFAQADSGLDRSKGGLGIGLSLAQRLIDLHGGHIEAQSSGLGQGSEFSVSLPVAGLDVEAATGTATRGEDPSAASHGTRVLIVDDNIDAADALGFILEGAGYRVLTAHDGEAALRMAHDHHPAAALLDLGLPRLNGYELAERLRAEADGKGLLLVAVSGYGQQQDRERSHAAGFDHHLVKPVDHDALLELLAHVLVRARRDGQALGATVAQGY
jgi:PAS domain S-box-containing protein